MKIEKLPYGSYRIRKMYKGKTYTVVFDYKPTQEEAMQAMAAELDKVKEKHENMTFKVAAEKYIDSKRNILSPSTIKGYGAILQRIPNNFLSQNIHDITCFLFKAQDTLGIPRFSIHKLRHYFASEMSALGIPEADILKMGGWETDHVMKSVYRHSMMDREEQAKREAAQRLRGDIF